MSTEERARQKTKAAGLAFMVGVIISMLAPFLLPGGFFVEYTDPADYVATVAVLGDYPSLGHVSSTASIIGMLLMIGGVLRLYTLSEGEGALTRPILRFGVILTIVEWALVVLGHAERHLLLHLLQRGDDTLGAEGMAQFETLAIGAYADVVGAFLGALFILPFASFLLGLGLMLYMKEMNIYKIASYALMVVGVVIFVVLMAGMYLTDLDLQMLLFANNLTLMLGSVALFIIGFGMYRGQSDLSPGSD